MGIIRFLALGLAGLVTMFGVNATAQIDGDYGYYGPNKAAFDQELNDIMVWMSSEIAALDSPSCRRKTYGRTAGKSAICPSGYTASGSRCVKNTCPTGMKNDAGKNCRSICPEGFRDDGLYCKKKEDSYGRGIGRTKKGCRKRYGSDNCQKHAGLWYKKCRNGYTNYGSNICRTSAPNCDALGLGARFDMSCKKLSVAAPTIDKRCPNGFTRKSKATLCYKSCRSGYAADALYCRQTCPSTHTTKCGAAYCTKTSGQCTRLVVDQTESIFGFSLNAATAGRYSSIKGLKDIARAAKTATGTWDKASYAYGAAKVSYDGTAYLISRDLKLPKSVREKLVRELGQARADYVITRYGSLLFALGEEKYDGGKKDTTQNRLLSLVAFEPSGIADIVKQFKKPPCLNEGRFPANLNHIKSASTARGAYHWLNALDVDPLEDSLRLETSGTVTRAQKVSNGYLCRVWRGQAEYMGIRYENYPKCIVARHSSSKTLADDHYEVLYVSGSNRWQSYDPNTSYKMESANRHASLPCKAETGHIDDSRHTSFGYVENNKCWVAATNARGKGEAVIGVTAREGFEVLVTANTLARW